MRKELKADLWAAMRLLALILGATLLLLALVIYTPF
jgi:hypothetical protein